MPKFAGSKRKKESDDEKDDKAKKVAADSSSDSGPDDNPPSKKATPAAKKEKKGGGDDEEASFPLSKNKFVKVRMYQGNVMVDIREFYFSSEGELKPGRKGITLNPLQWEHLKSIVTEVDAAILERI